MTKKNLPASVQARLRNIAAKQEVHVEDLLTRFVLERLLHRLAESPEADRFVLKGSFLFNIWTESLYRPTRDIDLVCFHERSPERIESFFRGLCEAPAEPDGVTFDPQSITTRRTREGMRYEGLSLSLRAGLATARLKVSVDISFGGAVQWTQAELPTLLDLPAPRLRTYSREAMIAEKFHAVVDHGIANTRLKDYFDIDKLARAFPFEGGDLAKPIATTFGKRSTPLPAGTPPGLSDQFASDPGKDRLWRSFADKLRPQDEAESLSIVVPRLREFLLPLARALSMDEPWERYWPANGPWRLRKTGE